MPWLYLLLAGVLEIGWAIGLKYTDGFTRLVPSTLTLLAMGGSLLLLSLSLRSIPLGTAYAVWTGIGAAGTALLGILLLAEPANAARLLCITLIVVGTVGLKFATPA